MIIIYYQVNSNAQIDIIQTLMFSFSLALPCRILFYTELTHLLWNDINTITNTNNNYGTINKNVLSSIQQKVSLRLSKYFITDNNEEDDENLNGLIFSPLEAAVKFNSYECASDDVGALLLVSFALELKTEKENVLDFMKVTIILSFLLLLLSLSLSLS